MDRLLAPETEVVDELEQRNWEIEEVEDDFAIDIETLEDSLDEEGALILVPILLEKLLEKIVTWCR